MMDNVGRVGGQSQLVRGLWGYGSCSSSPGPSPGHTGWCPHPHLHPHTRPLLLPSLQRGSQASWGLDLSRSKSHSCSGRESRASCQAGLPWAHPKNIPLGSAKCSGASIRLFRVHRSFQGFQSRTWALISGREVTLQGEGSGRGQEGVESSE